MSPGAFDPPFTPPDRLANALRQEGYAVLSPQGLLDGLDLRAEQLADLAPSWDRLPPDDYLKDGGRYRTRRHACYTVDEGALLQVPHRAHWQPLEYNALHGGMQRWFAPVEASTLVQAAWQRLMKGAAHLATELRGERRWFVEAHQFRIDTAGGIGRPTPEGAHRDGVDLVAVLLVDRHQVKGGETRVFEAQGRRGERFTMSEAWTLLVLDDARVIHESTPIQPLVDGEPGWRDTLVITCRAGAFQGE